MIPAKEKAKELYNKYFKFCNELSHDKNKTLAKLMAITCVNEMIKYGDKRGLNWLRDVKQAISEL